MRVDLRVAELPRRAGPPRPASCPPPRGEAFPGWSPTPVALRSLAARSPTGRVPASTLRRGAGSSPRGSSHHSSGSPSFLRRSQYQRDQNLLSPPTLGLSERPGAELHAVGLTRDGCPAREEREAPGEYAAPGASLK